MANNEWKGRKVYYTSVEGSAARQAAAPDIYDPEKKRKQREKTKVTPRVRKNRERLRQMTPGYVAFLAVACVALLMAAAGSVRTQTAIANHLDDIEALKEQLLELQQGNAKLEGQVAAAKDLGHIYEEATTRLGMVKADDKQIIYYEKIESGYVQQYEEIPGEQ